MQCANYLASRMASGLIRARTQASVLTDRLRHGRATVVKLCDMAIGGVFTCCEIV